MSTSASPAGADYTTYGSGPNAPIESGNLHYGDTSLHMVNPAHVAPGQANPYAYSFMNQNRDLYNQYQNSAAGSAFNPGFYQGMKDTQEAALTTHLGNQYARMGLAGSSAEMGGLSQAIQQNDMNWMNRQQSDQQRALQTLSGLNNQAYQQTMGIQNQYGNFQDSYNQNILGLLGMQQQEQAANQQFWGGIIGSGLGAAGMAAGGMSGSAGKVAAKGLADGG